MGAFRLVISALRWALAVCVAMALCSCVAPAHLAGIESGQQLRQIQLSAAGNEWVSFDVQLVGQPSGNLKIRLAGLEKIGCDVRVYGREKIAGNISGPGSALVPMKREQDSIGLSNRASVFWIDVHVPARLAGSEFQTNCELLQGPWVVDRLPISLKVYDFSLQERATLPIVGEMNSAALQKLYNGWLPDSLGPLFETCRENRVELWFSDLLGSPPATSESSPAAASDQLDGGLAIRSVGLNAILEGRRSVHWRDPAGISPQSLPWFYPGQMFGQQQPVQSIWLKFMRQGEEDAEYLKLAEQRGQGDMARKIARLQIGQEKGKFEQFQTATDEQANRVFTFQQGRQLLAELIEVYDPVHPAPDEQKRQLKLGLAEWIAEHGRPRMLPRWTRWTWDPHTAGQMDLELGIDIFNPSDNQATGSTLRWSGTPVGWRNVDPPTAILQMAAHQITQAVLKNSFDATGFRITTNGSMQAMVISGFDGSSSAINLQLPLASCDRRSGSPVIDGSLSDWSTDDTAFNGSLIHSSQSNFAAMRKPAPTSGIYTNFSSGALFIAFRTPAEIMRLNRCRLVIQPIYADGSSGPTMHLTCTGNGECHGAEGIRCAATVVDNVWRGELAIPWSVMGNKGIPTALRFNFIQYDSNGWASMAGPMSADEDDAMAGILVLRNGPGQLVK